MQHKILMSQRKYGELLNQLNKMRDEDFPRNRRSMKEAMVSGGGMHDNAAYEHALQDERILSRRIAELEQVVSGAQIIAQPMQIDSVQVGHRVVARDLNTGSPYGITICGYMDTDLDRNWCSYQAPLAASFIGRRVGDQVAFLSPGGERKLWEILEISITDLERKGGDSDEAQTDRD